MNITLVKDPKLGRVTYWKLNTSILNAPEFLSSFSAVWIEILKSKNDYGDIADWWDEMGKPSIKQFCICFSKHKRAVQRDTVKFLLSCLKIA